MKCSHGEVGTFAHYWWKHKFYVLGRHFGTNKLKMYIPSVPVTLFLRSYLSGLPAQVRKDLGCSIIYSIKHLKIS